MKKIAYSAIILLTVACSQEKTSETATNETTAYNTDGKTVLVYTTADSTDYRLSSNGTLEFKEK